MNFFRTLQRSHASFEILRNEMVRRRFALESRRDIPPEPELVEFVHALSDDDFHKLLVVCGAFMAKARGYDVFNLPHPPDGVTA